ncbi:hypothetical protein D2T29_15850 [Sinirhodobacter populi]|uniref:DUF1834 family protein n=1 Tax=Paenirhodobacter populi TaxID=2306993 RepID=A0A443K7H4_9RHOB|nr:hypothetical protein [Sinirhodobacter populi]RWR28704.1 hypothetical protein D2T29_15850 [Sinirhodobacter populi]
MLAGIHGHLREVLIPTERWDAIEVAEDIDAMAARAGQVNDGSLILMPWRERAGAQQLATGGFRQRVEVQFATGIVIREYDTFMGGERALRFDALKADVEQALAGWEPPGGIEPCELIGGESSPVTKGVSIFVQTWATARFLTGA